MNKTISIDNKIISSNSPAYLIAEIGLNHNNNIDTAYEMIKKAKESGADAVKFQAFKTENLFIKSSPAFDIFKKLELRKEDFIALKKYCDEIGITFFASPFCFETADLLEEINVPVYKIASMDINYYELIEHIAMKRKPLIVSTGMSSLGEIERAVNSIYKIGNKNIILLHCISKYPSKPSEMNLNMISKLKNMFPEILIGLSDHCIDNTMSLSARTQGAVVFERHFTLDRDMEGPDQKISLDPAMFKDLRDKLNQIDSGFIVPDERFDIEIAKGARRSLFAKCNIAEGTVITKEMIAVVRPGNGIAPEYIGIFSGREAKRNIKEGEPFTMNDI